MILKQVSEKKSTFFWFYMISKYFNNKQLKINLFMKRPRPMSHKPGVSNGKPYGKGGSVGKQKSK